MAKDFFESHCHLKRIIEKIDKEKVFKALRHASKHTQKGDYHKTRHGFELLELIDPGLVRAASRHADNLFVLLESKMRA